MNLPASAAAVFMLLATPAWCATRLAIVADDDSQQVADALATGLSTHKELELASHDDAAKALKEHALPANATAAQELGLAKALQAKALLILNVPKDADKPVLRARLFSAQQSVILFDSTAPFAAGKTEWLAGLVEGRVARLLPKLDAAPGKLTPVSIADVKAASGLSPGLGATVTALLASRFEAEPGLIVQERRSLDLLAAEGAPGDEASKAYWAGTLMLDGSVEATDKDWVVSVHLRLRRPNDGGEKTFTAGGAPGAAKDLVAKLAGEVLAEIGQPAAATAWDPNTDARQFLDDTVWAKKLGEYGTAMVAVGQACALGGDTLGESLFLRAWLNTMKAGSRRDQDTGDSGKPLPLQERYDATMIALESSQEYIDGKFPSETPEMEKKYEGQARAGVVRENAAGTASVLLAELTDNPAADAPPREPLRQALRKLLPFDPGAGRLPGERWDIAFYASYWADSPDELISYYYASMLSDEDWQKTIATDSVWRFAKFREGIFNSLGPVGYGEGEEGNVSVMDSPPHGPNRFPDAAGIFNKLTEKFAANPRTRVVAYLIRSGGSAPLNERKAWFGKFLNEFWDRRGQLMKEKRYSDWLENISELDPEVQSEYPDRQLKLLRYFLVNGGECWDYFFKALWKPETFPQDQAGDIWKEFNAYRQRMKATDAKSSMETYAKSFLDAFPAYKTVAAAAAAGSPKTGESRDDPLIVTGWHPYGGPGAASERFVALGASVAEGKLWVWGKYAGDTEATLLGFDLGTFKVRSTDISPPDVAADYRNFPGGVLVTPDAFYVTNGNPPDATTLSRYDRKRRTWETRRVPGGSFAVVNGSFYINLFALKNNVWLAGLARYDWDAGKLAYLVDSHRKPALNQFDSIDRLAVSGVFEGPGSKICAVMGAPYYVREDAGDWEMLDVQPGEKSHDLSATVLDGKALIISPMGDWAYYYGPGEAGLEAWVAPKGQALWDPPPEMQKYAHGVPNAHFGLAPGGMIWIEPLPDSPRHFELRWFKRDGPRAGEKATLLLKSDNAPDSKPFGYFLGSPQGTTPSAALNTEKGIVIWNDGYGFWFVPYADIEEHLGKIK